MWWLGVGKRAKSGICIKQTSTVSLTRAIQLQFISSANLTPCLRNATSKILEGMYSNPLVHFVPLQHKPTQRTASPTSARLSSTPPNSLSSSTALRPGAVSARSSRPKSLPSPTSFLKLARFYKLDVDKVPPRWPRSWVFARCPHSCYSSVEQRSQRWSVPMRKN